MKGLFTALFALIFMAHVHATNVGDPLFAAQFDKLAEYYSPILRSTPGLSGPEEEFSEEKVRELYRELQSELRVELNPAVLDHIRHFTTGQRSNFEVALSLETLYRPIIIAEINARGLPAELAFLPVALTGMHNQSLTSNGGTGIWGLNYFIALRYGLNINRYTDERKDPSKATAVALDYLEDLYRRYQSWNLAITAFATSPALVNKAITRSGEKKNFWEIEPYLPAEVRQIIPSFFASVYLINFHPEHDLNPPGIMIGRSREALEITENVSIKVLAEKLDLSVQTLELMNPIFRGKTIAPYDKSGHEFYIPEGFTFQVTQLEKSLYDETRKLNAPKKVVPKRPPVYIPEGSVKMFYTVRSGDYLGKIAEDHLVRVSYIKRWNGLRSDRINIGQKLVLYVKPSVAGSKAVSSKDGDIPAGKLTSYTVKEGDTLWEIAMNNPGNDIETLQRINKISDNIQPGQVIKIIRP